MKSKITDKIILGIIYLSLATGMFGAILKNNFFETFLIAIIIIFITLALRTKSKFQINFPLGFRIASVIFIFVTLYLGEIKKFYIKFALWDSIVHLSSAIQLGIIGFIILYTLQTNKRIKTSPIFIAIFTFTFALSIGALWEIFEFFMDLSFQLNMQKSGLIDTMKDLITNSIGAFISAVASFIYIKKSRKKKLYAVTSKIIKTFKKSNKKLYRKK